MNEAVGSVKADPSFPRRRGSGVGAAWTLTKGFDRGNFRLGTRAGGKNGAVKHLERRRGCIHEEQLLQMREGLVHFGARHLFPPRQVLLHVLCSGIVIDHNHQQSIGIGFVVYGHCARPQRQGRPSILGRNDASDLDAGRDDVAPDVPLTSGSKLK